ncbi:hypothetical protein NA57DRAFT_58062 [Rhizodiscina lignyota]|uniref:Uncharacterized protein n=1 Tax=Rhizodiscina lignyota TaxID=1504668 RepID=A0A9P4IDS2_9PEZI|nr:hypothetical protein NA57DRAFT_58062 [Rhizodiscina lignyota]
MQSHDSHSRSRSPHRSRHRSRSPGHYRSRSHDRHGRSHRRKHSPRPAEPVKLPLYAKPLSKHDFQDFKPLFALYLDVQKQLDIQDLPEREVKGRWKSFMGKWNRGELAEGWYDPITKRKAISSLSTAAEPSASPPPAKRQKRASPVAPSPRANEVSTAQDQHDDSSDDFGPAPLPKDAHGYKSGPSIPTQQDLALRDEASAEDAALRRADLRFDRKLDRKAQKERLDELVPRSEGNTHERRVEKRADARAVQSSYREAKDGGADDVGEGDLLGGEEGIEGYRATKKEAERKKNEREIRKEELWRARAAEREERLKEHRAKEDKTMEWLKGLARQRFGPGAGGENTGS